MLVILQGKIYFVSSTFKMTKNTLFTIINENDIKTLNISSIGLPDPFAKITVDGSGQCHSTDTCKATLDPKWNQHYDL